MWNWFKLICALTELQFLLQVVRNSLTWIKWCNFMCNKEITIIPRFESKWEMFATFGLEFVMVEVTSRSSKDGDIQCHNTFEEWKWGPLYLKSHFSAPEVYSIQVVESALKWSDSCQLLRCLLIQPAFGVLDILALDSLYLERWEAKSFSLSVNQEKIYSEKLYTIIILLPEWPGEMIQCICIL